MREKTVLITINWLQPLHKDVKTFSAYLLLVIPCYWRLFAVLLLLSLSPLTTMAVSTPRTPVARLAAKSHC